MEKYLDIHIIYCDKDQFNIDKLIHQCANFKIKNSLYKWVISVYIHNNCGKNNIGQFQRRLEVIKESPDDHFLWFVDGDDEIINDVDLMKSDFSEIDEIVFAHMMYINEKPTICSAKGDQNLIINVQSQKYFYDIYNIKRPIMNLIGGSLWNKWVKASCWKGVYEYLESQGCQDLRPNSSEDVFYNFYAIQNVNSLLYIADPIYFYHNENSSIFKNYPIIKFNAFKRFRTGHKEITQAIKNLNAIEFFDDFDKNDISVHLEKALCCIEIKKALDDVILEFGKDQIIKSLLLSYFDNLRHNTIKYLAYKYIINKYGEFTDGI